MKIHPLSLQKSSATAAYESLCYKEVFVVMLEVTHVNMTLARKREYLGKHISASLLRRQQLSQCCVVCIEATALRT